MDFHRPEKNIRLVGGIFLRGKFMGLLAFRAPSVRPARRALRRTAPDGRKTGTRVQPQTDRPEQRARIPRSVYLHPLLAGRSDLKVRCADQGHPVLAGARLSRQRGQRRDGGVGRLHLGGSLSQCGAGSLLPRQSAIRTLRTDDGTRRPHRHRGQRVEQGEPLYRLRHAQRPLPRQSVAPSRRNRRRSAHSSHHEQRPQPVRIGGEARRREDGDRTVIRPPVRLLERQQGDDPRNRSMRRSRTANQPAETRSGRSDRRSGQPV